MMLLPDVKLSYDDVLIVPQKSDLDGRDEVDLLRTFKGKYATGNFKACPIIVSNMYNTGTIEMCNSVSRFHVLTALHKYYSLDKIKEFIILGDKKSKIVFITIGQSKEEFNKLKQIREQTKVKLDEGTLTYKLFINLDVANGYRQSYIDYVKEVRELCRYDWIMAGNVTTPNVTEDLIIAGADIVKIGIGPGSVCETRRVAGVGYGQVSAIMECANAAHGLGGHICADGGCKEPGDVAKAFCAGADFVMLGGMFAGSEECEGEWLYDKVQLSPEGVRDKVFNETYGDIDLKDEELNKFIKDYPELSYQENKKSLKFFGMSSQEAMQKFGGEKEYRSAEGKCVSVPYKGPVANTVREILGGLRSCGTYIGARSIKNFSKCATLCRIR